jgi:hypothetical protein
VLAKIYDNFNEDEGIPDRLPQLVLQLALYVSITSKSKA